MDFKITQNVLFNVQKQFFATITIKSFKWEGVLEQCCHEITGEESQISLLNCTVLHPVTKQFPPRVQYQVAFLKYIIGYLEQHSVETYSGIYEQYCLKIKETQTDNVYLHFFKEPTKPLVSIEETVAYISNGTTGLSTWPAARVLAEYCANQPEIFKNRTVLELGCGTGLLGLSVLKSCSPSAVYLTDCHPAVLKLVTENLKLNLKGFYEDLKGVSDFSEDLKGVSEVSCARKDVKGCSEVPEDFQDDFLGSSGVKDRSEDLKICSLFPDVCENFKPSSEVPDFSGVSDYREDFVFRADLFGTEVRVVDLLWEDVSEDFVRKVAPDFVLAADVIYDELMNPCLVKAFKKFSVCARVILVACVVRNSETFSAFLSCLSENGGKCEELDIPTVNTFLYASDAPLKLLRISF